jgi:hypothetical protein
MSNAGGQKRFVHPILLTEHVFDKVRAIDMTLAEFNDLLITAGEVIEELELSDGGLKELVLYVEWTRPLHVVVIVDEIRREERILTVYEPEPTKWSYDFRRRKSWDARPVKVAIGSQPGALVLPNETEQQPLSLACRWKYAFPVARSGSRWRRQSNSTPVSTVYLPVVPSSPKPIGKRLSLPELVDRFEAMASHRRL